MPYLVVMPSVQEVPANAQRPIMGGPKWFRSIVGFYLAFSYLVAILILVAALAQEASAFASLMLKSTLAGGDLVERILGGLALSVTPGAVVFLGREVFVVGKGWFSWVGHLVGEDAFDV